jgi:hypothetical protein
MNLQGFEYIQKKIEKEFKGQWADLSAWPNGTVSRQPGHTVPMWIQAAHGGPATAASALGALMHGTHSARARRRCDAARWVAHWRGRKDGGGSPVYVLGRQR